MTMKQPTKVPCQNVLDAEQDQTVPDDLDQRGADHGAEGGADTAGQVGAANHDAAITDSSMP